MTPQSHMKKPPVGTKISATGNAGYYEGIALAAIEISKQWVADLRHIRDALDAGDNDTALMLMREFFVLHHDGDMNEKLTATKQ